MKKNCLIVMVFTLFAITLAGCGKDELEFPQPTAQAAVTDAVEEKLKEIWKRELKLVADPLPMCDVSHQAIVDAYREGFVVTTWCRGPFAGQEEYYVYLPPQFRLTPREVMACLNIQGIDETSARRIQRQTKDFWTNCDALLESCLRVEGLERDTVAVQPEPRAGFWGDCEKKLTKAQ